MSSILICCLCFFCKLKKGCTRLAAASDKFYQLLAHGWWFSPGTLPPLNMAEILLKVALKHQKSNQLPNSLSYPGSGDKKTNNDLQNKHIEN
jgi:hypothetical protein